MEMEISELPPFGTLTGIKRNLDPAHTYLFPWKKQMDGITFEEPRRTPEGIGVVFRYGRLPVSEGVVLEKRAGAFLSPQSGRLPA
jgi:hypothetical protein